ncbi:uncharacterized protein LOC100898721 [Galendromus occidentalis]|uniref:Uncharacterized protein LOC100898721 n=1 Tax=Galendromus occidentalis TaxID=34638 RepID=A0AAJ6QZ71_9ACAR|nr:uncharacterized protein LOC100898721 [Galendromus occidentalis]
MENTRFLTAIEETSDLVETKDENVSSEGAIAGEISPPKNDLIDLEAEAGTVKARRPRAVDQFFASQKQFDMLSPIKSKPVCEATTDPTQESLELKLEGSDFLSRPQYQTQCVQPNDSTITMKDTSLDNLLIQDQPEAEDPTDDVKQGTAALDNLSRKRLQNEMEPAVFDVPRATKILHREESAVPEFKENAQPILKFSSETDKLFKLEAVAVGEQDGPRETLGEGKSSDWKKSSDEETAGGCEGVQGRKDGDSDVDPNIPDVAENENAPNQGFNMTLDMTLRSSGGIAFASGLFLAIDEALDPLVGVFVPHGRRRRGANIVAVCIPIVLAIYFLFF